jgi:hypothetical protein
MKMNKLFYYLLFLLVMFLIIGSCATDKMAYISKNYEIYGTWVIPEYEKYNTVYKAVFHPNGKADFYTTEKSTEPSLHASFTITNKWIEKDGTVWHTLILKIDGNQVIYELLKMSDSGKTLEITTSQIDYPKEINSDTIFLPGYHILYRE